LNITIFVHSLLSDWNHGNAHFLRGIAGELIARGHTLRVYEPVDAWSVRNLIADHGERALEGMRAVYPALQSIRYDPERFDLDEALDTADLAIVHEWNTHDLVRRIGRHHRGCGDYALLFHDTHHRSVSAPHEMAAYDLADYDGVLAFGEVIRQRYLQYGWAARAWTWHEAADTRIFTPAPGGGDATAGTRDGDLIWIGNWGDGERSAELRAFLVEPVRRLGVRAVVHGVRYPVPALEELRRAGMCYAGWLPNYRVPEAFARYRVTLHVPRRPYVEALPGIPTIRPFEALACGIPLVSAPWDDVEGLFRPGVDYLVARNGAEMVRYLRDVLNDPDLARGLAAHGRETILARHTCSHRVDELLAITASLRADAAPVSSEPPAARVLTT